MDATRKGPNNKLQNLRRKIQRKIFEAIKDNDEWCIRWNHELDQLIKVKTVIRFIKALRLRWLGHVTTMDNKRPKQGGRTRS